MELSVVIITKNEADRLPQTLESIKGLSDDVVVVDDDVVEASNLQRQVIHTSDRIGMAKVLSAKAAIAALNPFVVVEAVQAAAAKALSFGAPTEAEIELAETLCRLVPSIEMLRLVSSGTEATMTAIRLARGHTGRSLIVKFEGCYHGHGDSLLVKAGSGALTFGQDRKSVV